MVLVTWLDADAHGQWTDPEEVAKMVPQRTKSVGFLARDDEHVVVIAQTENSKNLGDCLIIPRGMVRKIKVLS
jgi:hypothetical protein